MRSVVSPSAKNRVRRAKVVVEGFIARMCSRSLWRCGQVELRARQLKDAGRTGLPVVVLAGQELSAREVAALEVDGYLKKPVELEPLLSTVARYARPSLGEAQQSTW